MKVFFLLAIILATIQNVNAFNTTISYVGNVTTCNNGILSIDNQCICNYGYTTSDINDSCGYKQYSQAGAFILHVAFGYVGAGWFYIGRVGLGLASILPIVIGCCILPCLCSCLPCS